MKPTLDETHDPARKSWVESANTPDTPFPIQNLPLGVFRRQGESGARIGVAIPSPSTDPRPIMKNRAPRE